MRGADVSVREGEIVGVVGLVGAGKTELARLLFGADAAEAGEIRLKGKAVRLRSPKEAVDAGIVLVPEERRKEGIFVEESVKTTCLSRLCGNGRASGLSAGESRRGKRGSWCSGWV